MTAVITIKVKEDERLSGLGEHMRASRVQMTLHSLKSILVTWCLFFDSLHICIFVHFSVCMLQLMIFKTVKKKKVYGHPTLNVSNLV